MEETAVDRAMRRVRAPIIFLLILSGPVTLLSYGMLMKHMLTTAPVWISAAVVVSHIFTWLGIASLFDKQQERRQSSGRVQSAPLPPMKRVDPR